MISPTAPRHSTLSKVALYTLVVLLSLLTLLYSLSPWLSSKLIPIATQRLGLTVSTIIIDYPGWRGVTIKQLDASWETLTLSARDTRISYSWQILLRGKVENIQVHKLEIALQPTATAISQPTQINKPIPLTTLFNTLPSEHIEVQSLTFEFADIGFKADGSLSLNPTGLSLAVSAVQATTANLFQANVELSKQGLLEARLTLQPGAQQQGDQQTAFVSVQGDILADVLNLQGKFNLTDSTFKLATSLESLSIPTGKLSGVFNSTFSWPVTLEPAWIADNVTLQARLGGSLHMPFEEYEMTVSIPNSYALHYESTKLVGAGDMNIELHTTDTEVTATVHSLQINISETPSLSFSADVTGSNESMVVTGALASELRINNTANPSLSGPSLSGPSLSGPTTFSGQVLALQQNIPVTIKAQLNLAGKTLSATGVVSASLFNDAPFDLTHNTSTSIGHFVLADKVHIQQPLLASLPIQWEQDYDLDVGVLDVSADLRWQASAQIAAILDLNLADGRGHYEDYRASTMSTQLQLTNSDVTNIEGWSVEPTTIHMGRVDVGFPIHEVSAHLRLNQSHLTITEASATLLGGTATATTAIYNTNLGNAKFNLYLEDIDLAQILALEGEDITGKGTISGLLPISIHNNQVRVHSGELTAKAPGGTIHLSPKLTAPTGQVGLDFAVRALEDFRYTTLDSQINYTENGDLTLAIKLLGSNPEIENGRAIHYNLNVTENIPTLLQSLRLQDKVIERMERKVKK